MLTFTVRNRHLVRTEKPAPRVRPGWALVRVRLAGICNTDVELLRGYHNFRGAPGHEFVGEVVDVRGSAQNKSRWIGQRVVGEINIGCSALAVRPVCRFCRRGLKTHCARRKVLGIVAHDGAFAEYLTLPFENLHAIPDSIPDDAAVFTEPLAAACEILQQVPGLLLRGVAAAQYPDVAVLGDGKLAQLIVLVLQGAGLRVTMLGKHQEKLDLARRAGVTVEKVRGDKGDSKRVRRTFPLVIEATGSPTGLALAQQITEPRGTLVLKSTFHGAAPVETWPIVVKELTVVGSRCGPFAKALSLLRSGRVNPRPLISRTFPMAEAQTAIQFAQKPGILKVLLKS